jgi:hypothetical protein
MDKPSVPIAICKVEARYTFARKEVFVALVLTDPHTSAEGETEKEAIDKLREKIIAGITHRRDISIKIMELDFNEFIIQEIMDQ